MTPRSLRLAVPLAISLAFALLCITSLVRKSATWDENHYLGVGARPELREALLHPPLSFWIHSLPFAFWDVPEEVWREPRGQLRGQRLVALRSDDWMLDASRLALLPMGLALGWIVFAWGRRLYGFWGGALAMGFVSFDPNVIAHARLITPDLTLAASAVGTLYCLWRLADEPGWRRRILAGLAFAAMLLSKYTALLLAPLWLVADLVYRLIQGRASPEAALARAARDHITVVGIGALGLWAGYGFEVGPAALGPELQLPVPAPDYVQGAAYQWQQSRQPHDFWLAGQHSTQGWWYFYAVVMAIKVPLATLALIAARVAGSRRGALRWEAREVYLWLPALLLLFYLSFLNTIHNGFRYLLPVYPLLLVSLGRFALPAARSKLWRGGVAAAAAWLLGASVLTWPDYLAYCNELIGGSRNGYRWLSDSNLDWGQDLEQLGAWMRENRVERVQLAYFGTADPAHYGIDYQYLPSAVSTLQPTPPPAPGEKAPRFVALSAYQYQGVALPQKDFYGAFHRYQPNAQVGHSILIFDLENLVPRE